MESAIAHLKELSDNDMHLAEQESGEIVIEATGDTMLY